MMVRPSVHTLVDLSNLQPPPHTHTHTHYLACSHRDKHSAFLLSHRNTPHALCTMPYLVPTWVSDCNLML